MTNETIILVGVCCVILCLALLALAFIVILRRFTRAIQQIWDKQKQSWEAMNESQELMMQFILEFARVQMKTVEDLKDQAGGNGQKEPEQAVKTVKPARLVKGSPEAKEHMAKLRAIPRKKKDEE